MSLFSDFIHAVALDATQSSKLSGPHKNKKWCCGHMFTHMFRNNLYATEYLCLCERAVRYCFICI